jgi:hypothetical protein
MQITLEDVLRELSLMTDADRKQDRALASQAAQAPGEKARVKRKLRKVKAPAEPEPAPEPAAKADVKGPVSVREFVPSVSFDAETGRISRHVDTQEPDEGKECFKCGTTLEFDAIRCPMCGTKFDEGDWGLVSLLGDQCFELLSSEEFDCPQCGERVRCSDGACPGCGTSIRSPPREEGTEKLSPVVKGENVVFLHLDVESGEVEYLRKSVKSRGFEHMAVYLPREDSNGCSGV